MSRKFRRVVTSHDASGKAVVSIDDVSPYVVSNRPNMAITNLWSALLPVDNMAEGDGGAAIKGTVVDGGALFRIIEFKPDVAPRIHRTETIDYMVVLSGSIEMELEHGEPTITLNAGDTLIQRGTIHNWINRGSESCYCAFVMIQADPLVVDGKAIAAEG